MSKDTGNGRFGGKAIRTKQNAVFARSDGTFSLISTSWTRCSCRLAVNKAGNGRFGGEAIRENQNAAFGASDGTVPCISAS